MGFLEQLFRQNSWGSTLKYFRKAALEGEESLEYSSENWFSLGKVSPWTRAIERFAVPGCFSLGGSRLGCACGRRKTWGKPGVSACCSAPSRSARPFSEAGNKIYRFQLLCASTIPI